MSWKTWSDDMVEILLWIQVIATVFSKSVSDNVSLYSMKHSIHSGEKTFVVIADNPKMLRVDMIIKENKYNVAKPEWLKRALGSDQPLTKLIEFTPDDMLFANDQLIHQFDADEFASDTQPME